MNLFNAQQKAWELLQKYKNTGELAADWSFGFDRAKARFGCCNHGKRLITLSEVLLPHMKDEEVIDTILHEIAHAIVGRGHGHDRVWRAKAREIGCNGQRCGKRVDRKEIGCKYEGTCPNGHKIYRHKLTKNARSGSCPKCSNRFNPEYRFTWKQNF